MALDDLKLLVQLEELDEYSRKALQQFPKVEKFILCAEIRETNANLIKLTIRAAKRYHKKTTLQDFDIELYYLRVLVRESYDLKYINAHRFEVWSDKITEVGKIFGGWMKAVG